MANIASLSWHFTAPENTRIASFRIWRAGGAEPESAPGAGVLPIYTLNRDRNVFDGAYVDETCFSRNNCAFVGALATPLADANLVTSRGPAGRDIWLNASCGGDAGKVCPAGAGAAADMAWFRMYRAAVVLADDTDPAFGSPPAGSLFAGGTLAGSQGVSFSATDTGSGVQQATLEVDGARSRPRRRWAARRRTRRSCRASCRRAGRSRSTRRRSPTGSTPSACC